MKATTLFKDFFNSEKAGGHVLIACTILSLLLANSNYGTSYHDFFQTQFAGHSFEHWINDGLMTIFFLLIGVELEREIYLQMFYLLLGTRQVIHLKSLFKKTEIWYGA